MAFWQRPSRFWRCNIVGTTNLSLIFLLLLNLVTLAYGHAGYNQQDSAPQVCTMQDHDEVCRVVSDEMENDELVDDERCRFYLLLSENDEDSSSTTGGWRVYAGVDFAANDTVGPMDVGIILADLLEQEALRRTRVIAQRPLLGEWSNNGHGLLQNLFHSMTANASSSSSTTSILDPSLQNSLQYAADQVHLATPGLGSLARRATSNKPATGTGNLRLSRRGNSADQLSGVARTNPSVGSATQLQEFQYSVTRAVRAGEELVLSDYTKEEEDDDRDIILPNATSPPMSLDELQTHGMCLNRIDTKRFKAVDQQNGAFARQKLQANEIISPVPVVALSREQLQYQTWSEHTKKVVWSGYQLMLNYCYSHPLSNLVLFPLAPGVNALNHDAKRANVALRWSTRMAESSNWLNVAVEEVLQRQHQGSNPIPLLMELVALRTIEPGEELLLDFGGNWQRAWDKHVDLFVPLAAEETSGHPSRAPYTSNQFLRQGFRHPIELPDSVWPTAWKDKIDTNLKCGLYMAESAIPSSGLGMYSAVNVSENERIFYGDVVIQVEDYAENKDLRLKYEVANNRSASVNVTDNWLLNAYYWNADVMLAHYEADDIQSIFPGLGMLANSHPGLVNAEIVRPRMIQSFRRGIHKSVGATTSYHDGHFYATKGLQAGEEIFVKYGDSWFEEREDLGSVPLSNDFVWADSLLNRFWKLSKKDTDSEISKDMYGLIKSSAAGLNDRLASALPPLHDIHQLVKQNSGGTAAHSTPNRIRSPEWLEKNGMCLDNIRPGDSTISEAGKGAFATRALEKDTIIAPMPVVQILRQDLDMFEALEDDSIRPDGRQQLLNYCYGHPNSSLLFFPYSPVVNYINHDHTRTNVMLRWSTLQSHKGDWLNGTPADIVGHRHASLIMELVATRDIEPGEEIFIDYGYQWEYAWSHHVMNESVSKLQVVSAAELNSRIVWLRVDDDEQIEGVDSYSEEDVTMACAVGSGRQQSSTQDEEYDEPQYDWRYDESTEIDASNIFPCSILELDFHGEKEENVLARQDSVKPTEMTYTVLVEPPDDDDDQMIFRGVPRSAIRFFDTAYGSDMCLRSSFRHEIVLPDEMVPDSLRDLSS